VFWEGVEHHLFVRFITLFLFLVSMGARADDWPQFLGASRNGVAAGARIVDRWPDAGPKVLWEKKLGSGWSSPVASGGRLVIFHRVGDKERVECLDAATGKPIWKGDYDTAYVDDFGFDNGPRATPTVIDGRVYTFGAEGMLSCWQLADGKPVWRVDTTKEFKSDKGFFGMVCSPLVEGEAVVVNLGGTTGKGKGAGIAAFDRSKGQLLWQATDHEAGYSSPVAMEMGGRRFIVSLTRAGLVILDAGGKVIVDTPFRSRSSASVNAASPVIVGDLVFVSASYGTGAACFGFDGSKLHEVWREEEALSAHYATPVHHDGHLYGFDGRQETGCNLRCVELKTGKVKWSKDGFGAGTLMLAGGDLLSLHENGELIRARPTPEKFEVRQQARILGGDVRAQGALAGGLYFARDKEKLVCFDLREGGK
jgi:outer membrane protein assembly factor BamB